MHQTYNNNNKKTFIWNIHSIIASDCTLLVNYDAIQSFSIDLSFCNCNSPASKGTFELLCFKSVKVISGRWSVLQSNPLWKTGQMSFYKFKCSNVDGWNWYVEPEKKKEKVMLGDWIWYVCPLSGYLSCRVDGLKGACQGNKIWLNANVWLNRSEALWAGDRVIDKHAFCWF